MARYAARHAGWPLCLIILASFATTTAAQGLTLAEITPEQRERWYAELEQSAPAMEQFGRVFKLASKLAAPTVVHIDTEKNDEVSARYGSRRFVEEAGSGVIVQLNGQHYILTNWHVIKNADADHIKVKLADGRQLFPRRIWHDPQSDVAVMSITGDALVAARVGNSDTLDIGDFVLAVGSPFGLSHSVTLGIVSAKGRRDLELGSDDVRFQDFIQTDAAINPGNSGGPLINLRGEVVGINTAIASSSGGNEGIGFSIPMNMVMSISRQLIERGSVTRAFLGVHLDRRFGPTAAAELGLPRPLGAKINGITPNSPAEAARLQVGDVILTFNGIPIENDAHLINVVGLTEVNKEVPVVIYRNREEMQLRVTVGDRGQFEQRSQIELPTSEAKPFDLGLQDADAWDVDALGITVVSINPDVARRLQISQNKRGLVVTWVNPQGPLSAKLHRGEIIDQIDRQSIRDIDDLERILVDAEPSQWLRLHIISTQPDQRPARIVAVQPTLDLAP